MSLGNDDNLSKSDHPATGAFTHRSKPELGSGRRGTGALVAAGAVWTVIQTIGNKIVLFVNQVVLAWLLAPDDFGKIGLAYTVTVFVALLINPGIDVVLVRRSRKFHLWSTPAFYFGLLTGTLGCLIILAAAPLAARWYETPELVGVLSVLAFSTPLAVLLLVPTAKLRSEMRFKTLALVNLFQTTLQTVLTISFAIAGLRVYSFVLPMPVVYLSSAALLWGIAKPRLKLQNPLRYWKYLVGDSTYILGSRIVRNIAGQSDYMVLGVLYGSAIVGPYYFAFILAKQAIRLSAGSLQLVLTAGLTRLPAYSSQQTLAALRATRSIALVGIPTCMLQAALVDPLLRALYGDKWLAAIPLAQLLSVGMAFDVPSWATSTLMEARGQFRLNFVWWCLFSAAMIVAIFAGAYWGAAWGTALALCVVIAIFSPLFTAWLLRSAGVCYKELAKIYFLPLAIAGLGAGTALLTTKILAARGMHLWVQFGSALVLSGIVTLVGGLILARGWINDVVAQLKHRLPRVRIAKDECHRIKQA